VAGWFGRLGGGVRQIGTFRCAGNASALAARSTIIRNSVDSKSSRPTISLVGGFTLTANGTPDVFCSSTLSGQLTADLVLVKVGSIA
jgi:hypothetical protein